MKNRDGGIKRTIKRRIELSKRVRETKMGVRDKLRRGGTPPRRQPVGLLSRNEIRRGVKPYIPYELKDYGDYLKSDEIDYDVIIIISSYNRYGKLCRLLEQIFNQDSKYTYKVVLLNDGSDDYKSIPTKFPLIEYQDWDENGGRNNYWRRLDFLLKAASKYKSHGVIQLDDDFILCESFINNLIDRFFEIKFENNIYMLFKFHLGILDGVKINDRNYFDSNISFQGVDGGTLFDTQFLELINYEIPNTKNWMHYGGSGVWNYLNDKIKELGVLVYAFKKSFVYHDGNDDSQMHPKIREFRKYNTINYTDKNEKK